MLTNKKLIVFLLFLKLNVHLDISNRLVHQQKHQPVLKSGFGKKKR